LSTFPDGIFQYGGQPVGAGQFSSPWAKAYFVDGTSGSDALDGLKPTSAKATVQAAVTAAGRGDVIYIRPLTYTTDASDVNRYEEAITIPYATADLSLIGVSNTNPGNANYGAKLQYTETSGTAMTVNAPALHLENLCVRAEGGDYGVYYSGASLYAALGGSCGPTVYNCVFRGGVTAVFVLGGYASCFANSRFEGGSGQAISIHFDGHTLLGRRHEVRNCFFDGYNGTAISNSYIRVQGSQTDLLIRDCFFSIVPSTAFINATGTNLGLVANCFFDSADLSTGQIVEGGLTIVGAWDSAGINAST
jgi:hypothetical protein